MYEKTPSHLCPKSSGHVALSALLRHPDRNLSCNLIPETIQLGIAIIQVAQHKSDDNDFCLYVCNIIQGDIKVRASS